MANTFNLGILDNSFLVHYFKKFAYPLEWWETKIKFVEIHVQIQIHVSILDIRWLHWHQSVNHRILQAEIECFNQHFIHFNLRNFGWFNLNWFLLFLFIRYNFTFFLFFFEWDTTFFCGLWCYLWFLDLRLLNFFFSRTILGNHMNLFRDLLGTRIPQLVIEVVINLYCLAFPILGHLRSKHSSHCYWHKFKLQIWRWNCILCIDHCNIILFEVLSIQRFNAWPHQICTLADKLFDSNFQEDLQRRHVFQFK